MFYFWTFIAVCDAMFLVYNMMHGKASLAVVNVAVVIISMIYAIRSLLKKN